MRARALIRAHAYASRLVLAAALLFGSCARDASDSRSSKSQPDAASSTPEAAKTTDAGPQRLSRKDLVAEIGRLIHEGKLDDAKRLLDDEFRTGTTDKVRAWYVAHFRATVFVLSNDLKSAQQVLDDQLASTADATDGNAFFLRSSRAWLRWADHDFEGALREVDAMEAIAKTWPANDKRDGMLHVLWDRAYLTLDLAEAQHSAKMKKSLTDKADEWRRSYEKEASPEPEDATGRSSIGIRFALARGDSSAALLLARGIDINKADPQDRFIAATAFLANKDRQHAAEIRKLIADGDPSLMSALVLRMLDKALA